jgi:RHS repeat-associated protein
VEPTEIMTFSTYGLTAYDAQYWNGSAWVTVTGGSISGNNKVWRKLTFSPVSTSKIRVLTNAAADNGYSRIVELEAWGTVGGGGVDLNWLVTDQLGTPRIVFDKTGAFATVKRHEYLPFGEELSAGQGLRSTTLGYGPADGVRQKFTLKERDNETGLDYFGERYYASTMGRFTSPDEPFADQEEDDPQSWNLYSYVRNDPLKYIDPFGDARWVIGEDGQEHYVGDEKGEYDKDLNATWDGSKWNFHENNGQDNTVGESAPMVWLGPVVVHPAPPQIKLGEITAVALYLIYHDIKENGWPRIDPSWSNFAQRWYVPPPDTLPGFPDAKRVRSKSHRRRWADDDGYIYEWDYQHGRVEKYDKRGRHLGEYDADTGAQTKPADPTRRIEP